MRRPDWRGRLFALIAARAETPFTFGSADCCLWAADAVLAMTGRDFAHGLRGRYETRFGALKALRRCGFARVREVAAAHLAPTLRARCGDVILIADAPLDCLLIADGRGGAWGQDALGVTRTALPPAFEAWSV